MGALKGNGPKAKLVSAWPGKSAFLGKEAVLHENTGIAVTSVDTTTSFADAKLNDTATLADLSQRLVHWTGISSGLPSR